MNDKSDRSGEAAPGRENPPRRRILVLEDDASLRHLAVVTLRRAGYEVESAEDGQEGWEAIHKRQYDLLVTDNNMPRMTGWQLVEKLRSANSTLPVILASGSVPANAADLNLAAVLSKPFSSQQLVETVRTVFGHANRNDAPPERECESSFGVLRSSVSTRTTKLV